ncbi:MAG: LapA family protein [Flavobacteriales bacterium]|nr:MAG: LapA family protein [Flavobacteriales bacterium]
MSGKTITIIILSVLLTIFLMVNNDAVSFDFILWKDVQLSKLIVIGVCILIGFILGFIAGRPRKTYTSYNDEIERGYNEEQPKSTLSDEDRDYIS